MLYFRRERGLLLFLIVHRASLPRLPCRGVAQPGRAPGSGPGGRRFKSSLPDHSFQALERYFWFFDYISVDEIVDGACGVSPQNETALGSTLFSEWRASMSKQTRYSLAFRERAIRRMKLGDNASKLARELGVHRTTLYGWKRKLAKRRYRKMADLEPDWRDHRIEELEAK